MLAAHYLWELGTSESETQYKRNVAEAIKRVAKHLGNTPAICRKSYVHPDVIDGYGDGSLFDMQAPFAEPCRDALPSGLYPEEAVVLAFLKRRAEPR